jgi:hypothetical protein
MVTYFNLHSLDNERLPADAPNQEHRILRCSAGHLDVNRRVSDLAVEVKHNNRGEAIIWAWISGCLVHERLLEEFRRRELTGYRVRDASVRFRDRLVSAEYRELIVTGWAGVARPESGIRVVKSCRTCHWKKYSGLRDPEQLIDWSQWTAEDFFIVWPLPNFILITERVAELLLNLDAKSFDLRSLDQLGGDCFTVSSCLQSVQFHA